MGVKGLRCGILASLDRQTVFRRFIETTGGLAIVPLEALLDDKSVSGRTLREAAAPARGEPATCLRGSVGISGGVVLRACRPRQWSKNLLVFAAPAAAGWIDRPEIAAEAAGALLVLCMISSATYLVNDVRDREQDREHPRKRLRPVAAAELSVRAALWIAAALAVSGNRSRERDHARPGSARVRLSGVDGELLVVAAAGGRARHPGRRSRVRDPRPGRRRGDRHLCVALVCDRDGVLRHIPRCRQALRRASRAFRARSRAGDASSLLAGAPASHARVVSGGRRESLTPPGRSRDQTTPSGMAFRSSRCCCASAATRC